jgi:hypothetical protein
MKWVTGIPLTVVMLTSGTMVSPWPPSTSAWMSSTLTSISMARKAR